MSTTGATQTPVIGVGRDDATRGKPLAVLTHTSLVPLVLLGITLVLTRSSGVDDAYISYRYAANFTAGRGLVFNLGQRVEGISNLLWTLALAGVHELGVSLPLAGSLLGIGAIVATVILTRRVALSLGISPLAATATAAAVAITTDLVASATMGLEGGLYVVCLLGIVLVWGRRDKGSEVVMAIAITSLGATRPEGLVLGLILVALRLLVPGARMSGRLLAALASVSGLIAIEAFRLIYYGQLLPMSVTAKRDIGVSPFRYLPNHIYGGLMYLRQTLLIPIILVVVVGVALALLHRSSGVPSIPLKLVTGSLLPLIVILATGLGVPLLTGGDWMPNNRLVAPYIPIFYLLVAAALTATNKVAALRAAVVLPVFLALLSPHHLPLRDGKGSDAPWDNVGRALERSGLGSRVAATTVLGRMGYWAPDVRFTDMLGLTEPTVARTHERGSVFGKFNLRYTLSLKPAIVACNFQPDAAHLLALTGPGDPKYVAIVSSQLSAHRVFLLADPAVASRFLAELRRTDPAATFESADRAVVQWARIK